MDLGIAGRRAAVAAASKGLGFGVARALAAEGVHVAICGRDAATIAGRRRERRLRRGADRRRRLDADGATGFVRDARAALGGVDILVANAGGPPPGDFASTTVDQYLDAFELNCRVDDRDVLRGGAGDARAAVGAGRRDHVDRGAPADRRRSSSRTPRVPGSPGS